MAMVSNTYLSLPKYHCFPTVFHLANYSTLWHLSRAYWLQSHFGCHMTWCSWLYRCHPHNPESFHLFQSIEWFFPLVFVSNTLRNFGLWLNDIRKCVAPDDFCSYAIIINNTKIYNIAYFTRFTPISWENSEARAWPNDTCSAIQTWLVRWAACIENICR